MSLPADYNERVYAGVLGKVIGVYLGRPFEGWTSERILRELGEIKYYVNDHLGKPLIVPDDDITGTFTFIRALADHGYTPDIRPDQIGDTWLNYIIQNRSILWWGGMGNSTEHTAYLRLKQGVRAPESGSMSRNSQVVAEQIGAQIFIDGWGMVAPGDPERAADLARRAGSVSHDGEALFAAQVVAAMEALAFVEPRLSMLQETALRLIPAGSIIHRLVNDVREWRSRYADWHDALRLIQQHYGYDRYGGNCHVVPNHALIHLGLLYSDDDFQRALMVTNTAGWDTDCNSANVGCLMGIKNGLRCFEGSVDWRGPVADRIYLPTADGGRCISDAAAEARFIINIYRQMNRLPAWQPQGGARFHFAFPGAVQGFELIDTGSRAWLANPCGEGLELHAERLPAGQTLRAATPTFLPLDAGDTAGYALMACPSLYSGQQVEAFVQAPAANSAAADCTLWLDYYDAQDALVRLVSPGQALQPGGLVRLAWQVPDTGGMPIYRVGVQVTSRQAEFNGMVQLRSLDWHGAPRFTLRPQGGSGKQWRRTGVDAVDPGFYTQKADEFRIIQNEGSGMVIFGAQDWQGYAVEADLTPHMLEDFGLAFHVQGLRRFIGLTLNRAGQAEVFTRFDAQRQVLARASHPLEFGTLYRFRLESHRGRIRATLNGALLAQVEEERLTHGAVALLLTEGRLAATRISVEPAAD